MPPESLSETGVAPTDPPAIVLTPGIARIKSSPATAASFGVGLAEADRRHWRDCELAWDFVSRSAWYEIWAEYASNAPRPMTLKVDRDTLLHLALSETTGGQSEAHLSWRFQARVFLYAGLHQLSLCRADDMPNVRTIAILPVQRPAAQDFADVLSTDDHAGAARTEARSAWGKGLRRQVPERVLVCVLAQTRAYQFTWRNFKRHVLDELEADLAVCIGVDDHYDYANPFWQHARVPLDWPGI